MAQSFTATIDAWARKSEARLLAIFQTAAQFVVEDVIDRTPVDTGYLRASFTVSLDGPLPMRGEQGDGYAAPPIALSIAGAKLGDTLFASFVASYAVHVEYGARGYPGAAMTRLAVQNWQGHVDRAVSQAKARVRSG